MKKSRKSAILLMSLAVIMVGQAPAQAFTSVISLAIWAVRQDTKKALEIPQHAAWCAKQHPGYRAKWNNYRVANGRVKYCASPYHMPAWMTKIDGQ